MNDVQDLKRQRDLLLKKKLEKQRQLEALTSQPVAAITSPRGTTQPTRGKRTVAARRTISTKRSAAEAMPLNDESYSPSSKRQKTTHSTTPQPTKISDLQLNEYKHNYMELRKEHKRDRMLIKELQESTKKFEELINYKFKVLDQKFQILMDHLNVTTSSSPPTLEKKVLTPTKVYQNNINGKKDILMLEENVEGNEEESDEEYEEKDKEEEEKQDEYKEEQEEDNQSYSEDQDAMQVQISNHREESAVITEPDTETITIAPPIMVQPTPFMHSALSGEQELPNHQQWTASLM